jgi:hypothetical protein
MINSLTLVLSCELCDYMGMGNPTKPAYFLFLHIITIIRTICSFFLPTLGCHLYDTVKLNVNTIDNRHTTRRSSHAGPRVMRDFGIPRSLTL